MIKSFKHKGLKKFFLHGDHSGIDPQHSKRLTLLLDLLDRAEVAEDMNTPGSRFHKLKGTLKDFFSVTVSGNWRLVFRFLEKDAHDVDYKDYH